MITYYLFLFLAFSVIGWLIDSGYRSLMHKKWLRSGYFRGPFCPIYGVGGLSLVVLFKHIAFMPYPILFTVATIALILVEFIGGILCEKILKVKLWDYSSSKYHLWGHVDLLHSLYWAMLAIGFYFTLFPVTVWLEKLVLFPELVDLLAVILFFVAVAWLVVDKHPSQYLEMKQQVMNITVDRYRTLFFNLRSFAKTTSIGQRRELLQKIKQQLQDTGAYLRKK